MVAKNLYTIGYEGLSPDAFLSKLRANNVDVVIDVREVPHSRKRGFSKSHLDAQLTGAGISYLNFRELGSPAPARKQYKEDGDFVAFARSYDKVLRAERAALEGLYSLAAERDCCLLCYEADAETCHRSLVGAAVAGLNGGGFTVIHL
jgi:uncharacterized protein (DUF488 family)